MLEHFDFGPHLLFLNTAVRVVLFWKTMETWPFMTVTMPLFGRLFQQGTRVALMTSFAKQNHAINKSLFKDPMSMSNAKMVR